MSIYFCQSSSDSLLYEMYNNKNEFSIKLLPRKNGQFECASGWI